MATEALEESAEPQHTNSEVPSHIQEASATERPPEAEIHTRWNAGVLLPIHMPVDECWRVFRNFASPQELITDAAEVKIVEGEPNAINSVRFVKGANLGGRGGTCWAYERLLRNDDENRIQTYRVEENSFGFANYEAYVKVDRGKNDTSVVTWNLEMDAVPGLSPPPNPITEMTTDLFRMFLRHAESRYHQRKGIETESPAVVTTTA